MKTITMITQIVLSLSLIFTSSAWARDYDEENSSQPKVEKFKPTAMRNFLALYKKSQNFEDLLKKIEGKASPSDMAYLKKITQNFKAKEMMPTLEIEPGGVLVFDLGGLRVPVEVVSLDERIFKINHHIVNFDEMNSVQEQIEAIQAAFPKQHASNASPLIQLLMPEAQAFIPLIVGAAVVSWPYIVAATGAGIAAYELYTTNSYYCNEILEAANGCKPPIDKMLDARTSFDKVKDDLKAKKKSVPNCPSYADKEAKDAARETKNEAMTALDTVNSKSNSKYAKLIKCDVEWTAADKCKSSLNKLAKDLCMDINKSLDSMAAQAEKSGGK